MNPKKFAVILLAATLLVACLPMTTYSQNQKAPTWTKIDGNADLLEYACNLNASFVSSEYTNIYPMARVEVYGGFLVDSATNLTVMDDNFREVEYDRLRLKAGTYYFQKTDPSKPWGFYLTKDDKQETVKATLVFVRQTPK